jgi:hypothetical protein
MPEHHRFTADDAKPAAWRIALAVEETAGRSLLAACATAWWFFCMVS